ncbi:MAG: DUF1640 domain-containing protein [Magnetococcales bacterium]|nr:DUF1640 domain-containing protein [Magnetococcales bacterium]MBF0157814.1 DUF1640 domain-containing protein [Magnetococcales bacterium]
MTAITFDTLKYANRLKAAGVPDKQAEAMAEAQAEVSEKTLTGLVTEAKLEKELSPIRTDLAVIKWMLTVLMAGVMALVLKSFFPH